MFYAEFNGHSEEWCGRKRECCTDLELQCSTTEGKSKKIEQEIGQEIEQEIEQDIEQDIEQEIEQARHIDIFKE